MTVGGMARFFVRCIILSAFFLATILQLGDHFLFHLVDVGLLLFEALACLLNVFLQKLELLDIEVAIFSLRLKVLLLLRGTLSPSFEFGNQSFLCLLLLGVVAAILGTITLLFQHLVNHILDVSRRGVIFDFSPLLHNSVFEFDSKLVLA